MTDWEDDRTYVAIGDTAPLTREAAVRITNQIAKAITVAWNLIVRAYHGRAWEALGYDTWDAYCQGEFGHARLALPAEERPQRVRSLRDNGLSSRAIASATGVSQSTVLKDLHESGERNLSPAVTGIDGKTYSPGNSEVIEAEIVEEEDGVPEQKRAMNRVPLPRQFARPVENVERYARRVAELTRDDRFNKNSSLLSDLYLTRLYEAQQFINEAIATFEKRNGAAQ